MSWALAYLGTLAFAAFVLWLRRQTQVHVRINAVSDFLDRAWDHIQALEKHTHDGLLKPEERNLLENLAIEAGLKTKRVR